MSDNKFIQDEQEATTTPDNDSTNTNAIDETVSTENEGDEGSASKTPINKLRGLLASHKRALHILRITCIIGFVVFAGLFINETVVQPYRNKKNIDHTRDLYHTLEEQPEIASPTPPPSPTPVPADALSPSPAPAVTELPAPTQAPTPTPDPNRDSQGRLLQFQELLAENEDVKGWITIPKTNVDYVVMQSGKDDPEFYLDKGFDKKYSKAGTLFMDINSSAEKNTQNIVIHGHNMVSTKEKMFHSILEYKKSIKFYREHPLIEFDTIYQTGTWKVFATFITPPDPQKSYFFEFRTPSFKNSSEFLNFVYQIRIRSILNVDTVDINENDQLLILSTCSYEVNDNYRTIVVARKVREGESTEVDVKSAKINKTPLYADDYYKKYGGKAPKLAATFEEALANGDISWYTPLPDNEIE